MRSIVLLIILALHVTGLWGHLPSSDRQTLLTRATPAAARTVEPAATAPAVIGPLPIQIATTPLVLDATAAIAVDRATATVLYAKNVGAPRPIASVTKLVTALVIAQGHQPGQIITIPKLPAYESDAEVLGLVPGDTFRLDSLLEAMLIPSANDAADTLAIADSGSIAAFTAKMNTLMNQWGIEGTHFASASGLQDTNNYASAAALAKIAGLALHNPTIASIVGRSSTQIISGQGRTYNVISTNELLASGQFYGIKTGYTAAAGECFVGLTRINGHEVITVVLDAGNRFGATTTLANWIQNSWQWI